MLNKLLSIIDNAPSPSHSGQTAEHLLSQAAPAPLSKGQIQEIFPATRHHTVQ